MTNRQQGGTTRRTKEARTMKDGEVAVITSWSLANEKYTGRVVQLIGQQLVSLGMGVRDVWPVAHWFSADCRVRPLSVGDRLVVTKEGLRVEERTEKRAGKRKVGKPCGQLSGALRGCGGWGSNEGRGEGWIVTRSF